MAIKRIRELPKELPHARLYLDDIEEIRKILIDACTTAEETKLARYPHASDRKSEVKTVYHIGDWQMDSIDDLVEYGRPAKDFRLVIISDRRISEFAIYPLANPRLDLLYPLEGDACWSVYAQVKAIVDRRRLRFKYAILAWPGWLQFASLVLIMFAAPYLLPLRISFPSRLFAYAGLLILVNSMVVYVIFHPSRVFFVRSRERSKLSASARKDYIKTFVLLFVGGVLGKIIDLLFAHFR